MQMFASDSHTFEVGRHLAQGPGIVTFVLFVTIALGRRFGQTPTHGQALGRVQAAMHLRWVGLAVTVAGISLMVIGRT